MAYPATPVSADQVGYCFVQQYYQVLQGQFDYVHKFYNDASTIIRVSEESTHTASGILQINKLIMSLDFTGIEIKAINSLESWSGGVLVVVSGSAKSLKFRGRKKFMQTLLLAPQEEGYFILNDIFHFLSIEAIHQNPTSVLPEGRVDYQHQTSISSDAITVYQHPITLLQVATTDCQHPQPVHLEDIVGTQPTASSPLLDIPEIPKCKVETSGHITSAHVEENGQTDKYSLQEQQEEPATVCMKKDFVKDSTSLSYEAANHEQELPSAVGELQQFTHASILRAPKGKTVTLVASETFPEKTSILVSEWRPTPQPSSQLSKSSSSSPDSSVEAVSEGESRSVYVKNLPLTVSALDIMQKFESFGRINPDGVLITNRKDIGICFAFVEFEDVRSVHNAITASPIQLSGREVYIEERKPSSSNMSRGGRRGRGGRGSYQQEAVRGSFGKWSFGKGVRSTY
ncbi:Ras-GTPase-activating protein-binding protein [Heracleum sosnowskyi]|uniref:Ras-GTPase-activating protein-binding protein n=1 Tax=Heracleum sosnowskyi TaxID=360622 RepID=A0AAD8GRQ4_9APIA|nr:Ras-GTPase-activating protein-binding protein [Heracleum sosnowskyi]